MISDLDEQVEIDREKIRNSVRLQMPLEITTYTLSRNMEIYIYDILRVFLEECHQEQLNEYLKFCLGELLTNAKKANTKRVYFREKGFDINNPEEYERGMNQFKIDTLSNIDHYLELQQKAGLYIKLVLQICGRNLKIQVKNNCVFTLNEESRIRAKIQNAQKFNSIDEVYAKALDQSEGAGLGIIIIILMLQKVGLGRDNYKCYSTDKETITEIILPCNEVIYSAIQMLTYEYINLQEQIPIRLASFKKCRKLFNSASIDREELFKILLQDDTLSLLLLKNTVDKGKETLDLKKVLEMFSDDDLREIINEDNHEIEIMEFKDLETSKLHSQKVAYYAYNLCKNNVDMQGLYSPEEFYSIGLINNIGLEVLKNPTVVQEQYIRDLSDQYQFADKIRDVFYSGHAGAYIGYGYLKKLKFSENVTGLVGCWNNIEFASDKIKNYLPVLYVSEMFLAYSEKQLDFYQIDPKYLSKFDIYTKDQFEYILNKLNDSFEIFDEKSE